MQLSLLQPDWGGLGAGVDEAGRGPLAGPVVAAAVILDTARPVTGLRDSKQLSPAARAGLALEIRACALAVGVGEASVEEIDAFNILQATLLAMQRALCALRTQPEAVWVDGNRAPTLPPGWPACRMQTIVKGDALVPAISAASIIAKTHRDALMRTLDQQYPGYGLAVHHGYPTPAHLAALARLGPAIIHRRSFAPVRSLLASP